MLVVSVLLPYCANNNVKHIFLYLAYLKCLYQFFMLGQWNCKCQIKDYKHVYSVCQIHQIILPAAYTHLHFHIKYERVGNFMIFYLEVSLSIKPNKTKQTNKSKKPNSFCIIYQREAMLHRHQLIDGPGQVMLEMSPLGQKINMYLQHVMLRRTALHPTGQLLTSLLTVEIQSLLCTVRQGCPLLPLLNTQYSNQARRRHTGTQIREEKVKMPCLQAILSQVWEILKLGVKKSEAVQLSRTVYHTTNTQNQQYFYSPVTNSSKEIQKTIYL